MNTSKRITAWDRFNETRIHKPWLLTLFYTFIAFLISTAVFFPKWHNAFGAMVMFPLLSSIVALCWLPIYIFCGWFFGLISWIYKPIDDELWWGFCSKVYYWVIRWFGAYLPLYIIGLTAATITAYFWPALFPIDLGNLWFHDVPAKFMTGEWGN